MEEGLIFSFVAVLDQNFFSEIGRKFLCRNLPVFNPPHVSEVPAPFPRPSLPP